MAGLSARRLEATAAAGTTTAIVSGAMTSYETNCGIATTATCGAVAFHETAVYASAGRTIAFHPAAQFGAAAAQSDLIPARKASLASPGSMIDGTKASADSVTTSEWPCARRSVASSAVGWTDPESSTADGLAPITRPSAGAATTRCFDATVDAGSVTTSVSGVVIS